MNPLALGAILTLVLCMSSWAQGSLPVRLHAVEDSSDRAKLWALRHATEARALDELTEKNRLSLLVEATEEGDKVIVLRDGTEAFRLPDSLAIPWLAWSQDVSPERLGHGTGDLRTVPVQNIWRHLQGSRARLWDWMLWPTGLEVEVKSLINALPKTKPTVERRLSITWAQSLFTYGHAEVGIHRSQWGGGVTRYLRTGEVDFFTGIEAPPPYWDDADWWWHFAVGGPVLQYEMRTHGGIVPAHLVFDRDAVTHARRTTVGPVVNWFDEDKSHEGNLSHAVNLRFGHLRYSFMVDGDAYEVPIMRLGVEGLPYGFGHVHFGIWSAADVFMTHIALDVQPPVLTVPVPASWPTRMRIMPIRLELLYRDERQFQFSLSTQFSLDNALFSLPGGRP